MLTSDQAITDRRWGPGSPGPQPTHSPSRSRWTAAALGLLAALLAVAFPLLPVQQNTAELRWPTASGGTAPVTAPLVAYRPQHLDAEISCSAIRDLDAHSAASATLFATTPPASPDGAQVGLTATVGDGMLTVVNRGEQVADAPVPPGDCVLTIRTDAAHTVVGLGGSILVSQRGDHRPQVVGVYSDLDGTRDDVAGAAVRIEVDNRFDTSATGVKIAAGVLIVLAMVGSLWALRRIDGREGRRLPRTGKLPGRLRGHDPVRDLTVLAVLAVWLVIGATTTDDGYILDITRAKESSGFIGNYYRWFNAPEAPFGWFYELYSLWSGVSGAVLWLRIPAFVMGVASWLLLSRWLLPRLGVQVRRSRAAGWAAAAVFLCFWLPFNNGLRPEPVVVIAALLSLCAMERALATRRLVPVALALVAGAFAVAATPTGLLALAPLLGSARPLLRLLRERAATVGWAAVLGPLAAAGTVVLVAIFGDQTYAAIAEATRVRTEIGPNLSWFAELYRYNLLFSNGRDGSLARRFPVLLLMLCTAVATVVMLRRGRIPGAALGPGRRLIGSIVFAFAVLTLTPTKWTHHFGAFAALGAGMAALAALATSTQVLRSRRNQAAFLSVVLVVTALAFTGPNAWYYVSSWGVPWFDKAPVVNGYTAMNLLLMAAAAALVVAVIEHLRGPEVPRPVRRRPDGRTRALRLGSAPLAVICGLVVLFEMASMVKGMQKQAGSYSLGADILTDPAGARCGLAGRLFVETEPSAGVLPSAPPVGDDPGQDPIAEGFHPDGLPPTGPGSLRDTDGQGNREDGITGTGPLGGPVLGSFVPDVDATGTLRTGWYALPAHATSGAAPLVLGIAGQVGDGTSLTLEFARTGPDGTQVVERIEPAGHAGTVTTTADPLGSAAGTAAWRDVRLDLAGRPAAEADRVRILAEDRAVTSDGWIAVAPPRVPLLTPMTELMAGSAGALDWPVPLASPCLRPFGIDRGVAELPRYRVLADQQQREVGDDWSSASAGGPLGWIQQTTQQRLVPTYLEGEWDRDWGQLRLLQPYAPDAGRPDVVEGTETVWGWQQAGPIGAPPPDRSPAKE
ncbi:arabinosyltransferase domain-containing protein [Pseudonocardia asaccharolytica]|uniref:arabinosyltransferase domain-containing protein n=1 Tax=Pseudonocardia asaccharolytica TaxID=54010 RepID=UPI0004196A64|nr:arabinosyltransferase domain-containing protein [Pseudonocardia asaccharolytica]